MSIQQNISLKEYNTFGIDVNAQEFTSISSVSQLQEIVKTRKDIFVLGGGSNLLLTQDIEKLVVHLNTKGITTKPFSDTEVVVTAEAGENWHEFVLWCIDNDLGGIENLSLIPGNVGTCPIQNIGAYGVEVKDTILQVEALELNSGKIKTFTNQECNFGYRNSVFKNELKGKYILLNVSFKLTKNIHKLNYSYGAIQAELTDKNIDKPTIKNISDAVIAIRNSKLPNPNEIGNSGSFFKNPVITNLHFEKLQKEHSTIPSYPVSDTQIKVPAGWLIEQSGYKGKRIGNTGSHKNQALVLVNYGNATGKEVFNLAKDIQKTILENFGITLEIEVNVI